MRLRRGSSCGIEGASTPTQRAGSIAAITDPIDELLTGTIGLAPQLSDFLLQQGSPLGILPRESTMADSDTFGLLIAPRRQNALLRHSSESPALTRSPGTETRANPLGSEARALSTRAPPASPPLGQQRRDLVVPSYPQHPLHFVDSPPAVEDEDDDTL